jgi:membrane protein DedA with SNARE-associated domain
MPEPLAALLARYGYAVVFAGVFLENVGLPVPGETALLAAGFLAQRGTFSLPWVIGLGIAAAILGDNLGYWIGRLGGRRLAERHGRLVGLTPARLASLEAFFARHGPGTVFFARFLSGLRVFAAPVAGMSRLPWSRFLLYNAAGAIVWATAVGSVGYLFGRNWGLLEHWVGRVGLFGLAVALALVALARRPRRS